MSGETPEERFLAEDENRYSETGVFGPTPNVGAFIRGYQHGASGWDPRHLAHEAYRAGHALGVADAARAVDVAKERYGPQDKPPPAWEVGETPVAVVGPEPPPQSCQRCGERFASRP